MNINNFNNILPEVLCHKIYKYVPHDLLYLTNKKDYINYQTKKYTSSCETNTKKITNSYVMRLIKNDYYFIFKILLDLKFKMWYKAWKINYKGSILPCFIELLNYVCIENSSSNCRKVIQEKMSEKKLRKNKHKRIRTVNSRWSN